LKHLSSFIKNKSIEKTKVVVSEIVIG